MNIYQKNILSLKCNYANLVSQLVDKLSIHNCNSDDLKTGCKIVDAYIKRLNCYNYLTYAYVFDFSVIDESNCVYKFDIGVRGLLGITDIVDYSSVGNSLSNVINSVSNAFLHNSLYSFNTIIDNNLLYVYSSDPNLFYSDSINLVNNYISTTTITDTSLECSDFEIEHNINSIPFENICQIFAHANKIVADNGIVSCGCN